MLGLLELNGLWGEVRSPWRCGTGLRQPGSRVDDGWGGGGVPLAGEYEPGTVERSRDRVEIYERSGGTEGTTTRGRPVSC
jgi:hypothetical protein